MVFLRTLRAIGTRFANVYSRIFHISEIAESRILQWFFGAMALMFFATFERWVSLASLSIDARVRGEATCWPYALNCTDWYFFQSSPFGLTQYVFYGALFVVLFAIAIWMRQGHWVRAHAGLALLLTWKVLAIFVLSYSIGQPYDYWHIALTAILLFSSSKIRFLRITFIILCFLSVTRMFDASWIAGTYFTSSIPGVPLFPDYLAPVLTNAAILTLVIAPWLLLSRYTYIRLIALGACAALFAYTLLFLPVLFGLIPLASVVILFWHPHETAPRPGYIYSAGSLIIVGMLVFHFAGFIPETTRSQIRSTPRLGFSLLEANRQCVATVRLYTTNGPMDSTASTHHTCERGYCLTQARTYPQDTTYVRESRYEAVAANSSCDPYVWWESLHRLCDPNPAIERIEFLFDSAANGGPFYRIVDTPNICDVSYSLFGPNTWILSPEQAEVVGYPVKNFFSYGF